MSKSPEPRKVEPLSLPERGRGEGKAPAPLTRRKADGKSPPPSRKGDTANRIYDEIRQRILSLALQPGAPIDEASLVREFGKSRTPVREALVRLASSGLVVLLPNRGSQVAPLDLSSIRDYFEAIDVIQRAVTVWATVRRTPQDLKRIRERAAEFAKAAAAQDAAAMVLTNHAFHTAIADACGNVQMAAAYGRILDEGLRIARFSLNSLYGGKSDERKQFIAAIVREHDEMIEAIDTQNAAMAEDLAISHTELTRVRFSDYLGDTLSSRIVLQREPRAAHARTK